MRIRQVVLSTGAVFLLLAVSVAWLGAQPGQNHEKLFSDKVEMDISGEAEMPGMINYGTWFQGGTLVNFDHEMHAEDESQCIQCHHVEGCRGCHSQDGGNVLIRNMRIAYHTACFRCHEQEPGGGDCNDCHTAPQSDVVPGGVNESPQLGMETHEELLKSLAVSLPEMNLISESRMFDPEAAVPTERIFLTNYNDLTKVSFSHQGHVEDYGISCASCHHMQKCGICHMTNQKRLATTNFEDAAHAKCIGCHEEVDAVQECDQCHLPIRFE